LLIDRGANLAIQDCKARTVYHCAAAKGQYECLEVLLNKSTSIWLRNNQGDYPIHEAYYNKNLGTLNK
jgi:ankyrin repeat protein